MRDCGDEVLDSDVSVGIEYSAVLVGVDRYSRIGATVVGAAQLDCEAEYARAMTQLIGDVETGIASQGFLAAITRLSEFTKANCGVDVEGALKALQEKYMNSTTN